MGRKVYLPTFFHKFKPNVGEYASPMDPMGTLGVIQLMEEILHQLVGSLSQYLQFVLFQAVQGVFHQQNLSVLICWSMYVSLLVHVFTYFTLW